VSRSPGKATHRYHEVSGRGLVRVRAASVNPLDWHFMRGTPYVVRAAAGLSRPKAKGLGADMAGQVEAVGKDVTEFRPGDEVFGSRSGTFAEYVSMPEDGMVLAKPTNRGWHPGSSSPATIWTSQTTLPPAGRYEAWEPPLPKPKR
jgi:NADPH:quinone reductase-like Zn-dependent oxidoreductase